MVGHAGREGMLVGESWNRHRRGHGKGIAMEIDGEVEEMTHGPTYKNERGRGDESVLV
jgi:hypothetical protein